MNRVVASLSAAVLAMGVAACSSSDAQPPPKESSAPLTVPTSSGTLHGIATKTARQFLGVRYAQAPTGERRWTDPQPAPAAPGVVEATKAAASCPQAGPSTSEDCLFLNVTTPAQAKPGAKLPVMVWWHGGGYTTGAGSQYDAQRLASQGNVMVVTVNYRLGVLGYLGLPGLKGSGTFGFADQLAATRWAKQNAAAFGGDPGNLTVFGESAGGMSACALLTSPAANGLVQRIALSSGSCLLDWPNGGMFPGVPEETPYKPVATTEQDGLAAAKTVGCKEADPLPCLRKLTPAALMKINQNFSDHLSYGTDLLPAEPAKAVRDGKIARIPVLSGGNRDEHNSFIAGLAQAQPKAITEATLPALAKGAFGAKSAEVLKRYPVAKFASPAAAWARIVTDSAWACPTLAGDQAMAKQTKVYGYEFADPKAPNVSQVNAPSVPMGAAHASDLPSLFDLGGHNFLKLPGQPELGASMVAYWSSFARTGVPAAPGVPTASAMTPSSTSVLAFAPNAIAVDDTSRTHQCDFWSTVR